MLPVLGAAARFVRLDFDGLPWRESSISKSGIELVTRRNEFEHLRDGGKQVTLSLTLKCHLKFAIRGRTCNKPRRSRPRPHDRRRLITPNYPTIIFTHQASRDWRNAADPFGTPKYSLPLFPIWERAIIQKVRVIARSTLKRFIERTHGRRGHAALKSALEAWFTEARNAKWRNSAEVKRLYATASIVSSDRMVFNIKGNDYRLVVAVDYEKGIVWIKWIGTHAEYDGIDVRTAKF